MDEDNRIVEDSISDTTSTITWYGITAIIIFVVSVLVGVYVGFVKDHEMKSDFTIERSK